MVAPLRTKNYKPVELRAWANHLDGISDVKPEGPNPATAPMLVAALEKLVLGIAPCVIEAGRALRDRRVAAIVRGRADGAEPDSGAGF